MILGNIRLIVSRKAHACYWCGEAIEVGQPTMKWAQLDMKRVSTIRAHRECYYVWAVSGFNRCSFGEHKRPERPSGTAQEGKEQQP